MIVGLIVACEVGFWVLLAAGLATRYLLGWRRTSVAVLLAEPLLEVVLFAATAVDLKNGAEPGWEHGLAALYIGFTVAYGHATVRGLDAHAAHRLGGAPRPPKPPRHGMARARHEGRLWLRTLLASAVALALLQAAIWYACDGAGTAPLRSWQVTALRILAIHGLIALTYLVFPKKAPKASGAPKPPKEPGAPQVPGGLGADPAGEDGAPVSAPRPAPTARRRSPCSPSGRG
ncbi:hypothetical protein [Streptomyces sp. NRRL S-340]|uniref:hypothetical protein n=1 Tax=Streptomyces sp. NRRL S-340 TaxID=1463901 RepID=UPI000562670F|nr:hypothetical protein [Streptomyces sp. NRRL S-340]